MNVSNNSRLRIGLVGAGAGIFPVVLLDYASKLLCGSLPLLIYLLAGCAGVWLSRRVFKPSSTELNSDVWKWRSMFLIACMSFLGTVGLAVMPTEWDSKCAWRNCGRVLGLSLFQSPFPVGPVTCRGWSACINEYHYTVEEQAEVLRRINESGCPPP